MQQNQKTVSAGGPLVLCAILLNAVVMKQGFVSHPGWYALSVLTLPFLLVSVILYKRRQW